MSAIKVAELFGQVGFRVDFTQLNRFQQRLAQAKQQLVAVKALAAQPLVQNTNISAVRMLNVELGKTLNLMRQVHSQGPIRVRNSGPAAAGVAGARGGRRAGGGAGSGLLAGVGVGRGSPLARNFLGGFTAAIAVRSLFQAQVALDGIKVGIQAILKPGEQLGETMGFLRAESDRLGFEFSSSAFEFSKLAAAGNAAGLSTEQVREIFVSAQEAARVFSLSVADTEGVLKAFTQIISKGKVTAEELRNQLGDRLPAAVPLAAKALGVTTEQLGQMLEKGEILANDFLPKFAKMLRESFAGSVEEASQTAASQLNRFLNAWFDFRNEIIQSGVGEIFSLALLGATQLLKILVPLVRALAKALRAVATPIHALGRIMKVFFAAVPNAIILIGALTAAWALLAKTQIAALIPWILGAAAISAILIIIDDLATALRGGESAISHAADSTNVLVSGIARLLLLFGQLVVTVSEFVAFLATGANSWDLMIESVTKLGDALYRVLEVLAAIANFVSAGILGDIGSAVGTGTFRAQEFVTETAPNFAADKFNKLKSMIFGDTHVTVQAQTNASAEDIARETRVAIEADHATKMREAMANFGDLE